MDSFLRLAVSYLLGHCCLGIRLEELGNYGILSGCRWSCRVSVGLHDAPGDLNTHMKSIYLVRRVIRTFYEFLISSSQDHLEGLQKERDRTVAKLKEATKYDTTLQLLEKYGGSAAKPKPVSSHNRKSSKEKPGQGPKTGRVSFVPPPTANIPRPPSSATGTPGRSAPFSPPPNPPHTAGPLTSEWKPPDVANEPNAEFAPNAFNAPQPQYTDGGGSGWYDRLMDVLLGEDETNPKNRIVLICQNCRLVNGQAPPGVKTLQQVGEWRCTGCGTMNGQDLLIDSLASAASESPGAKDGLGTETAAKLNVAGAEIKDQDDNESDITQYSEDDRQQHGTADGSASAPQTMAASEGAEIAPAHSTRARKKQNAKG